MTAFFAVALEFMCSFLSKNVHKSVTVNKRTTEQRDILAITTPM